MKRLRYPSGNVVRLSVETGGRRGHWVLRGFSGDTTATHFLHNWLDILSAEIQSQTADVWIHATKR